MGFRKYKLKPHKTINTLKQAPFELCLFKFISLDCGFTYYISLWCRKTGEDPRVLTLVWGGSLRVWLLCPTLGTPQTRRPYTICQMGSRSLLFTTPRSWKFSWCTTGSLLATSSIINLCLLSCTTLIANLWLFVSKLLFSIKMKLQQLVQYF